MADHSRRTYDSILELLSGEDNPTPLVRINKVLPPSRASFHGKLEWYNPFGAVKDRIAANLIRDAEERGTIGKITKLVEPTSGNTGLGLTMIANAKGYSLLSPLSTIDPHSRSGRYCASLAPISSSSKTRCVRRRVRPRGRSRKRWRPRSNPTFTC